MNRRLTDEERIIAKTKRRDKAREVRNLNREKHNQYQREYYKKFRSSANHLRYLALTKEERRLKYKNYRVRDKDKNHDRYLRYTFNITLEDYNRILKEQNGVCFICGGTNKNSRRLNVDHDHNTGIVRGLLCTKCNSSLGWYERNKINIDKYLKQCLMVELSA